ncbi:MAG: RNA polymerase sigma-70 factor [Cytophagaceae bacterium]|nr:RNA polymerase sigma-70 factor [Cytophagaceae bacterium]|tara:strand:+ start:5036 stop:5596 length:561 start_codon:yes stop_codon:yes gene_type:complete
MDYNQIWTRLKNGDEYALRDLYNRLYDPLCSFSLQYTRDIETSRDIVQQVFVDLWEKKRNIQINQNIKSYLYRAVYNSFIDSQRQAKRKDKAFDQLKYEALSLGFDDTDMLNQKIKKLQKEIDALPPKRREILLMSKRDNMKYREIAEVLGISVKTVETQMRLAFQKIREAFEDDGLLLFLLFKNF